MSFFSSWLGSGKSRGATAAGRITVTAPAPSFKPKVEALELRAMPDATLVTRQPDFDNQTGLLDIPADAGVQVLGASSNGRFLLLQSKATNLTRIVDPTGKVLPQVSAPGQNNIYYLERRDDGTNDITLISAYNPVPAFDTQFIPGQKGLGAAESIPGQSLNAVLSDDGQAVAFLSGANAALFDQNIYLNGGGFAADSGGQDAFVWRASATATAAARTVTLVSKTAAGTSIGGAGGVTNPSISPDGKVVTFLSDFNAQSIANRVTGTKLFNAPLFVDDSSSPDIFRIDTSDPTAVPEPVSVLFALQPFRGLLGEFIADYQFQMMGPTGGAGLTGMTVDPLGRYVTAGGAGFVALHKSPISGNFDAFRFNYNINVGNPSSANNRPYSIDISNVDTSLLNNAQNNFFFSFNTNFSSFSGQVAAPLLPSIAIPGVPTTANGITNFSPPTLQTVVDAGSAEIGNAIVSLFNADVLFTYRQSAPTANNKQTVILGYTPSPSGTGLDQFDLIQKGFIGSTIQFRLVTHRAGSTTQGVGFLDQTVNANGAAIVNPGGYAIAPDAVNILFSSSAAADLLVTDPTQLSTGAVVDTNALTDVFQVVGNTRPFTSLVSALTTAPNKTGQGASTFPSMTPDGIAIAFQSTVLSDVLANTPDGNGAQADVFVRDTVLRQTILASGIPANIASGNGASVNAVVVRSAVVDRSFFRNFEVLFSSAATDLDIAVVVDPANPQVFSSKFPIFVSALNRVLSFSGGEGGFVTIARTDSVGNLIPLSKFQPFPGFTGELRVATADFTGDGVPDVAIGAGPGGGPRVSIFDGFTRRAVDNFFAFESSFTGGVYVAAGELTNEGLPELIVGAGETGGPRLQIYNTKTRVRTFDQFAYESTSRTGVHVATGDFNGDGRTDIFIGAGAGGGPRVRVLDGAKVPNQSVLADFFAFDSNDRNGVNISGGDYDSDGRADIVAGSGNGSAPRVIVYNSAYLALSDPITSPFDAPPQNELRVDQPIKFLDFTPFAPSDAVGARAILRNIDGGKLGGLVVSTAGQLPIIQTYSGSRRGTDASGAGLAPQLLKEQIPNDSLFGDFGAYVG